MAENERDDLPCSGFDGRCSLLNIVLMTVHAEFGLGQGIAFLIRKVVQSPEWCRVPEGTMGSASPDVIEDGGNGKYDQPARGDVASGCVADLHS